MQLHEQLTLIAALLPQNLEGAGPTLGGPWINVAGYHHCTILMTQGAWTGGTLNGDVRQALDVNGTLNKVTPLATRWQQSAVSSAGVWMPYPVTNNLFEIASAPQQHHLVEIETDTLDVTNGYHCLRVELALFGMVGAWFQAYYLLSQPRYASDRMPNPLAP